MAKVVSSTYNPESELYDIEWDNGESTTSGSDMDVGTSDGTPSSSAGTTESTATNTTKNNIVFVSNSGLECFKCCI